MIWKFITFLVRKLDPEKAHNITLLALKYGLHPRLQKIKIKTANDLEKIVEKVLKSNQKTILLAIYNTQNQRRYIGVKLD